MAAGLGMLAVTVEINQRVMYISLTVINFHDVHVGLHVQRKVLLPSTCNFLMGGNLIH